MTPLDLEAIKADASRYSPFYLRDLRYLITEVEQRRAEVERLRDGLLQCATAAGEDVSDGIPDWPDVVEWAVLAVREGRRDADRDYDEAQGEVKRLRASLDEALRLNREMYRSDEDVDSPGNMQHAVLVTALTPEADLVSIPATTQEDHHGDDEAREALRALIDAGRPFIGESRPFIESAFPNEKMNGLRLYNRWLAAMNDARALTTTQEDHHG
jgi:hypothetical protein